jgi:ABC-type phosphate transport system substrate-binding protein
MRRFRLIRPTTLRGLAGLGALAAVIALAAPAPRASTPAGYRVIVNASNPASAADRRFLADIFLKKVTRWSTGDATKPVDQGPDAAVRQRFSDDVLGRSVSAVKSYWAQLVFSGRDLPPPELDDDDEVVRFVAKHVGGVGYVSAAAAVDRVKVLNIR